MNRASGRVAPGLAWLESRTGVVSLLRGMASTPVPGGPRWAYVFGAALAAALALEAVTGALLTLYYVPSVEHAHATVEYVQKAVPLGWLVRGLHVYGAAAVIVAVLLHLAQTFVAGAYKERREALWLSGVVLLVVMLGLGYTGYQLPWDQRAYYSTQVASGVAGSVPVVGDAQSRLLLGGDAIGQATLSRFFALHVALLPAALALLVAAHLLLFRRRGFAGSPAGGAPAPYYPAQFARDTLAFLALAVLLVALSYARPAVVGPAMDPSAGYVARPEWFFLWTFQLLKVVPAFVGGVLIPGAIVVALAIAPFLDRSASRAASDRRALVATFGIVAAAVVGLTGFSIARDASDPQIAAQDAADRRALSEPFEPVVIGRPGAAGDAEGPAEQQAAGAAPAAPAAPAVFLENCSACHGRQAQGKGRTGPSLVGVAARPRRGPDDLPKLIRDPRAYGLDDKMPAFPDLTDDEVRAIAAWIAALR